MVDCVLSIIPRTVLFVYRNEADYIRKIIVWSDWTRVNVNMKSFTNV